MARKNQKKKIKKIVQQKKKQEKGKKNECMNKRPSKISSGH
jgi:hypothetical protein